MPKKKKNKIKIIDLIKNNKTTFVFCLSFIYLVFLGIILTYNYDFSNNYNLLFGSDSCRVISDLTKILANHYRATVHPLFIFFTQPVVFLISGVFINKTISIIVLSALVSSTTVLYLYKTLNLVNKKENINFILSLIYLFSFSNIVYTAGMETYNYSAFALVLLWYFYIKKSNDNYNKSSIIILIVLGILSAAFTITNFMIYLIVIALLIYTRKISIKKASSILIITLGSILLLSSIQRVIWNTPFILKKGSRQEEKNYISYNMNISKIKNVLNGDYANSLISSNINLSTYYYDSYNGIDKEFELKNNENNIFILSIIVVFYLLLFYLILNKSKNKLLNIGLLTALAYNSSMHLFYGNNETFLYSLHFLYLLILLYGVNYKEFKNKETTRIVTIFLSVFLLIEIIVNNISFIKIINYCKKILEGNYFIKHLGQPLTIALELLMIMVISLGLFILINIIKKIKKLKEIDKKTVYIGYVSIISIIIISMFIGIKSIEEYDILSILKFTNVRQERLINKENYLSKDFKAHFKDELQSLATYRKEIDNLKSNYDIASAEIAKKNDYYFFGFGNRKKLLYTQGNIIDINSQKKIYSITEDEYMIIPNIYSIIIRTKNQKYIKIYEDNYGVHYNVNGHDKIIKGTEKYIDLYNFDDQEYQNIKKELYGEILFNIKRSAIYPNIIVYNKPWYRDAALVSMVLKQTNNTDLIKDWVENINDIYDEQNGEKEVDNLGELLYILSTQKERNENLINEIEEEANRIAKENENGYYLIGKTDFRDMHLYQNLWYKLGIESVGREFKFDLDSIPADAYTKMAWWSNYQTKYQKEELLNINYPYLSIAANHKLKTGKIVFNYSLYPLSWEKEASGAQYYNYFGLLDYCVGESISPLHSWAAAEMLLFLMDETGNFELK